MFSRVVWATDGSEGADRALEYAKTLVTSSRGRLLAVHAEEHFHGTGGRSHPVLAGEEELKAKIRSQVAELRAEGLDVELEITRGHPGRTAHAIAEHAREYGADLIVVGTRGLGPVHGLLVGSVTHRLLHAAQCPVLAVPPVRPRSRRTQRETVGSARS
jgi:nucleotide-binding universal stress UspA family protein